MLVKNNQARLHQLGIRNPNATAASAVTVVNLLPGVNEIDTEAWKSVQSLPVIKHYLKTKVFEVVDSVDGLKGRTAAEALALIGNTYDLRLLGRWAEDDGRAKIQRAIDAQIALVHAAGDVKKE